MAAQDRNEAKKGSRVPKRGREDSSISVDLSEDPLATSSSSPALSHRSKKSPPRATRNKTQLSEELDEAIPENTFLLELLSSQDIDFLETVKEIITHKLLELACHKFPPALQQPVQSIINLYNVILSKVKEYIENLKPRAQLPLCLTPSAFWKKPAPKSVEEETAAALVALGQGK